jgi:predicted branched-subunit amino acid permease
VSAETGSYDQGRERTGPADIVSGYFSAIGIFAGLVALAWHPLRLVPIAMLLALLASAMATSERNRRLAFAAVLITALCFFLGMTISVVTERPLW